MIDSVWKVTLRKKRKKLNDTHSVGIDGIPTFVIKKVADILVTPITWIINSSISSGIFPSRWKVAIVKPVHKKNDVNLAKNYRPVSLLPIASKILEGIVHNQVMRFTEDNGVLPPSQHGFRRNRSTTSAVLSMTSQWGAELSNYKYVGVLLFDLSAAFDTLDVDILCEKLKLIGFDGNSEKWIRSFMTDRKQIVRINMSESKESNLTLGCPQGGILSPLLFILYMSDIERWTNARVCSYADDTTIFLSGNDKHTVKANLKCEAEKILKFMASNYLVANPEKTDFLILSKERNMIHKEIIKIGGAHINASESVRLLGMTIDNALTWENHVDSVINRIQQGMGLLKHLATKLPKQMFTPVTHGLVLSKLRYGLAVYGDVRIEEGDPTPGRMRKLQVALNRIARFLTGIRLQDKIKTEELLQRAKLPHVNQMAAEQKLGETFRAGKTEIPGVTDNITLVSSKEHAMTTRGQVEGNIMLMKGETYRRDGFLHKAVRLWNALPTETKLEEDTKKFKKGVKTFSKRLPMV